MRHAAAGLLLATLCCYAGPGTELARSFRSLELDPQSCYRVHELTLTKGDARLYFTEGYLTFGKPVNGILTAAVFTAEEDGDAEILVLPPTRAERATMASYTGSPNLNEHIKAAILTFSDGTGEKLISEIQDNSFNKQAPEMGVVVAERWNSAVRNISSGFETRLIFDQLSGARDGGFFSAAISGRKLANFDLLYDPSSPEPLIIGRIATRENRTTFDVWTSFVPRSLAKEGKSGYAPEFSLSDYRINATLEPDLTLKATTKVTLKPGRDGMRALPFDLGGLMQIGSASIDGQPVEVLYREAFRASLARSSANELLLIVPPQPLSASRSYEVEFRHEGKVIAEAGNRVYYVGARTNWYPNRGMQFATYDLTFRYPSDLDLVTTGDAVEDRIEGEWRITRRKTTTPIRLAGFNLGVYDREKVSAAGYNIEICANRKLEKALEPKHNMVLVPQADWPRRAPDIVSPRQDPVAPATAARLRELAGDIKQALEFMSARFGPPPLRSVTVSPVPGTFGQGFPGLIYLSTLSYLGKSDRPLANLSVRDQTFYASTLLAHETAHQWWGNVVATATYHDEWLMEALANDTALLFLEETKGAGTALAALQDFRVRLLSKAEGGRTIDSIGPIVMGTRLDSSLAPSAWRDITYGKGSWIIHMLRAAIGQERFPAMLRELRRRYEWKPVTTDAFRELAAGFLPPKYPDPKLEMFFDQWVYGTGIPAFKLNYSLQRKGALWNIAGTLTQSDVDQDFTVDVPVEIQFGKGKSLIHHVRSNGPEVSFRVAVKQLPTKLLLDPDFSILRR